MSEQNIETVEIIDAEYATVSSTPFLTWGELLQFLPVDLEQRLVPKRKEAKSAKPQRQPGENYRVKDIAARWNVAANTVIARLENEPGVLRLDNEGTGKRRKVTLSVPESVLLRVEQRFSDNAFQSTLARRNPLRVVHFRDLHARMPKQF